MREDGVGKVDIREFALTGDDIALDQFGDFRADHVRAEQFAGLLVEHGFDHAIGFAHGDGLAVSDEGEAPDLDVVALFLGRCLGETDAGDLGMGIGAAGHVGGVERLDMGLALAGNRLDADDAFMAGLVGEPWRAGEVADGVEPGDAGLAETVDIDVGFLDLHAEGFEAKVFDIADNADGEDGAVEFLRLFLAVLVGDVGGDRVLARFQVFDLGAGDDVEPLLLEILLGHGGNFGVLDRQDARQDFGDGHVAAELIVEAGEFDADGAGADDEEPLGHHVRRHGFAIGPDQLAVSDEAGLRDVAGTGTGGEHDVLGLESGVLAVLALDDDLGRGRALFEAGRAFDDVDLVLLHQELDAAGQLAGDAARTLDHGIEVNLDLVDLQAEILGVLGKVHDFGRAQQCLGRDTAPVEADAAKRFALDDGGLQAELAGADGRDIAAGAGADDDEVVLGGHSAPRITFHSS